PCVKNAWRACATNGTSVVRITLSADISRGCRPRLGAALKLPNDLMVLALDDGELHLGPGRRAAEPGGVECVQEPLKRPGKDPGRDSGPSALVGVLDEVGLRGTGHGGASPECARPMIKCAPRPQLLAGRRADEPHELPAER